MTVASADQWWLKIPDEVKCRVCKGFGMVWDYRWYGWDAEDCIHCAASGEQATPEIEALRVELVGLNMCTAPAALARRDEVIRILEANDADR